MTKSDVPVLIVRDDLTYAIEFHAGHISEAHGHGGEVFFETTLWNVRDDDHALVQEAFSQMLWEHDVDSITDNRADLGPLPGRYTNHPWALWFLDALALKLEIYELTSSIPACVSIQCYHLGDGDQQTVATVPFDGWEKLHALLETWPYSAETKSVVGADVMQLMRIAAGFMRPMTRDAVGMMRGNYDAALRWQIDSSHLPTEARVAGIRRDLEGLRSGAKVKRSF
jgi:hypothetical protein